MSAGPYRLPSVPGTRCEFRFNGRALQGIEGDTVASALLANGIRVVSRSFKFHRPRGVFSAGLEEPNALVQLHSGSRAIPSARATLVTLTPGLEVSSQAGWPGVSNDLLRAIDFVHPVFAAGFYNKTFMWPSWRSYERIIRKLAGFGRVPGGPDPDRYDTQHAHCDVLVVGGGRAGVEAASAAADAEKRVILVEQYATFGANVSRLGLMPNVQLLPRTTAVAYYDHDLLALVESVKADAKTNAETNASRERLWLVRAVKVVLATGAIEQPLIFMNNDRPGVMLAGAAHRYLQDHGVAPGHRVVIATNNDSAYTVACALRRAGVAVVALADSRESPRRELVDEARALGITVRTRSMPIDTQGFGALKAVTLGTFNTLGRISDTQDVSCDSLLVSGGWSPALHLYAQAGGKLTYDEHTGSFLPPTSGAFWPATRHPSIEIRIPVMPGGQELGPRVASVGNPARQWIDLRHDVTVADIELAVRENYTAVEHIKRYTTLGMSVDQGKTGQAAATDVIARTRGIKPSDLGHTTFRPPFVPVTLGTLVGRNRGDFFAPARRTPLYDAQAAAGALFDDFGEWRRAAAFPRKGESREQAMHREVRLVRTGVGIFDASPLGKIELAGPDALDFADRFYINSLLNLKPGRARYGIMLRETGIVFDDGTITVLDDDRVLLTTTSGGANRVAAWLEEWRQCEWPDLRVVVSQVTDQWAAIALTGQHARSILQRLEPDCDLANESFPHLGVRRVSLLGSEARVYRVSFSGELTYEINVPAHKGSALWSALLEEGRSLGIEPYGIDALLHLRMEKGFIHIGADTDGTTVPDDIGWGQPAAAKQRHYVGKRSLTLPENTRPDRLQLIGLTGEGMQQLPIGSHLRLQGSHEPSDGWITSAGALSTNGKPIALAVLRAGRNQMGAVVTVHDQGQIVARAKVVAPSFYDPAGVRMNA
jgi:sarcosine oxidase, subunit alpha